MEKSSTDGYIILLLGYARSPFRDFESYLRNVVGLDEDDIQLISKRYKSNFFTYEKVPGFFSIEDLPKVVYTMGHNAGTQKNDYDGITMKTKLTLTGFW